MTTPRNPSLLLKCEDFLVHPIVRTLSLAQRVDFLEKKGLSPKEITHCLTSVEQRNGLSRLAQRTAKDRVANLNICRSHTSEAVANKPFQLLQVVVKKYGVVTLMLVAMGYYYVQFRQRKADQLLLQHEVEKTQRKKHLHSRVEALLAVVKHQQMQYHEAVNLLEARVTKVGLAANETATNQVTMSKASASVTQVSRGWEFQELQKELMKLKSAVVDTYLHPRATRKSVEAKEEVSMLLRPSVTDKGDSVVQESAVTTQHVESSKSVSALHTAAKRACQIGTEPHKKTYKHPSGIRDQTTMSAEEITALFERGQVEEELSTAGSYRLLFATC